MFRLGKDKYCMDAPLTVPVAMGPDKQDNQIITFPFVCVSSQIYEVCRLLCPPSASQEHNF